MRVAEAVGRGLAGLGVNTVFGVVGSGNFHVTNALVAGGARFVAARHEGGATVMADAWARTTGVPGVVTVHQGPGLTNAMTGIAEAAKSRTPLLVLAAEAPEVRSNFHVDVGGLAAAVGAVGMRLYSPASALADAHRAYTTALGRRTVVLALPLNVQGAQYRRISRHRVSAGAGAGAAADLPDRPGRRSGHRAGRGAARSATPGVHRRPGCPGPGGRARAAGRRVRGAAGHLRGGQGAVPRQPVEPGCERRVRHAAGGRADRRRRRHRGLGLLAEHVDDTARQADPAAGHAGAGGRRPGCDRHAPAGAPRGARGRSRDGAGRRGRARRVAQRITQRGRIPVRGGAGPDRRPGALAGRGVQGRERRGADRPAHAVHRAGRPAPRGTDRRGGFGQLHGLPEHVPVRSRRGGLLLHAGVPVDRARPGHGHRGRDRPAGPAGGGRARRRRRADGRQRAGDRRAAGAADGGGRLRRRSVRRGGASLRAGRRSARTSSGSRRPTSPRSAAGSGSRG